MTARAPAAVVFGALSSRWSVAGGACAVALVSGAISVQFTDLRLPRRPSLLQTTSTQVKRPHAAVTPRGANPTTGKEPFRK